MSETIWVNKLPTRTWNRLGVNEAPLLWDEDRTYDLGETTVAAGEEPVRLDIAGQGDYSRQSVHIDAPENACIDVFETLRPEGRLHLRTSIRAGKSAHVRLVQLYTGKASALLRSEIEEICAENARIELIQILPGRGDVYSDARIDLNGDGASFSARKVFRGTIDFKIGSAGSVGTEKETVLMLGENAVNKTVPLILCAEENVEGNHGATIGEMDDETAFYFESRGINRETAENLLSRAAIERLARLVGDEQLEQTALSALDEEA